MQLADYLSIRVAIRQGGFPRTGFRGRLQRASGRSTLKRAPSHYLLVPPPPLLKQGAKMSRLKPANETTSVHKVRKPASAGAPLHPASAGVERAERKSRSALQGGFPQEALAIMVGSANGTLSPFTKNMKLLNGYRSSSGGSE